MTTNPLPLFAIMHYVGQAPYHYDLSQALDLFFGDSFEIALSTYSLGNQKLYSLYQKFPSL